MHMKLFYSQEMCRGKGVCLCRISFRLPDMKAKMFRLLRCVHIIFPRLYGVDKFSETAVKHLHLGNPSFRRGWIHPQTIDSAIKIHTHAASAYASLLQNRRPIGEVDNESEVKVLRCCDTLPIIVSVDVVN